MAPSFCSTFLLIPIQNNVYIQQEEPWGPPSFDPRVYLDKKLPLLSPSGDLIVPIFDILINYILDAKLPSTEKEVIVMVGFPGSGKSTFAKQLSEEHGLALSRSEYFESKIN